MSYAPTNSLADETRAAAANPEHPWDRRALDWPLNRDSVVVEVGGYKGRWALQIQERYEPRLYVFEPQPWAAATCREVLKPWVWVLNYALGTRDGLARMAKWNTDGCTLIEEGDALVDMFEISGTFARLGLDYIDLMLINIEGYEYTLIPHMLDRGIYPQRLMVQFHEFADPDGAKGAAIYEQLEQLGYTMAWTYGPVLTAWEQR